MKKTKSKLNTSILGYNKAQTDFEIDRLNNKIKILEGDVAFLKNEKSKTNE